MSNDSATRFPSHTPLAIRNPKLNVQQMLLQDVVKLVLRSDVGRDGVLSRHEASVLETRLSISMHLYGIVFDTEKFRRAVGLSPSLPGVMAIVKRLLPDENNRLSSFYSVVSEEESDIDDVYDMFQLTLEEERTASGSSLFSSIVKGVFG